MWDCHDWASHPWGDPSSQTCKPDQDVVDDLLGDVDGEYVDDNDYEDLEDDKDGEADEEDNDDNVDDDEGANQVTAEVWPHSLQPVEWYQDDDHLVDDDDFDDADHGKDFDPFGDSEPCFQLLFLLLPSNLQQLLPGKHLNIGQW